MSNILLALRGFDTFVAVEIDVGFDRRIELIRVGSSVVIVYFVFQSPEEVLVGGVVGAAGFIGHRPGDSGGLDSPDPAS